MAGPLLSLWPFAWRAFFLNALLGAVTLWVVIAYDIPAAAVGRLLLGQLAFLLCICWALRDLGRLAWRVRLFRTWRGRRVVLHYEAGLENCRDLAALQRQCEAELDDLAERFGFPLRRRLAVFLFWTWTDISKVFGEGYAGTALYGANAVVLAADMRVEVSLRHELTHLFAGHWNRQVPPLLSEGLATWLDGRSADWLVGPLLETYRSVVPDLLRRRFFFSPRCRSACYILAGGFTGFLIRRFGWDRYRTLYLTVRPVHIDGVFRPVPGPVRFAATFQKVFGLTLVEAERQWREEVGVG
jgi:hypothetical protein